MDERTMRQLKSVGKMALGAARVASGVVTGTGHGLVGGYLKSHHMMASAARMGQASVQGGIKQFKEGLEELNR